MKYLLPFIILLLSFSTVSKEPKIYVITYNPYNTPEEIGFIEEYEDDIAKSIQILNDINLKSHELNDEGTILFMTVLFQERHNRDISEFEEIMESIKGKINYCKSNNDCNELTSLLEANIKDLEYKLKHLHNSTGRRQDMTFFKEYYRSGKKVLSRIYDNVEMISVSNGKEFEKAYKALPSNPAVMVMDHAGNRNFGMRTREFIDILAANPPKEIILGICRAHLVTDKIKAQCPATSILYTPAHSWHGFDSREQGVEGIFPEGYNRL